MAYENLEQALGSVGNPVELLRNSQIGPYAFPVIPTEFTNWRDEQRSWRESCALFDQSHHMTDLYVEGPDALRLLEGLAINSFKGFKVDKAKQFIACNHEGYVIGDAILFYLAEQRFSLVGRPPAIDWVQFHCERGGYDVAAERDERSAVNRGRRKAYRFQVQGPRALEVMEAATGGPVPDVKFFNMDVFRIAGRKVRALRHGMVGQPGWELFGPWDEGEAVRQALIEAGRPFDLHQVGTRAYPTTTLESGWIPSPLPAVYTGEAMRPYREWLKGTSYEAMASLGGSFDSAEIEDYYLTPYELGYGPIIKLDHDFIGRAAVESMAGRPHREKVTLAWNGEDVARAFGSLFTGQGAPVKYIDLPLANYATLPYDKVLKDGAPVGLSTYTGYSYNERSMLSLACIDPECSRPGTEVVVLWGEAGGGSAKPTVERHVQKEIRATVGPAPYGETARSAYRPK
ncbi:MAG TPA: aminomethyl transferase family protein [Gammaproteobacteria bacterium]|nr:aminomethyl transferase family protein [Gammaproteobacteria bacterium]